MSSLGWIPAKSVVIAAALLWRRELWDPLPNLSAWLGALVVILGIERVHLTAGLRLAGRVVRGRRAIKDAVLVPMLGPCGHEITVGVRTGGRDPNSWGKVPEVMPYPPQLSSTHSLSLSVSRPNGTDTGVRMAPKPVSEPNRNGCPDSTETSVRTGPKSAETTDDTDDAESSGSHDALIADLASPSNFELPTSNFTPVEVAAVYPGVGSAGRPTTGSAPHTPSDPGGWRCSRGAGGFGRRSGSGATGRGPPQSWVHSDLLQSEPLGDAVEHVPTSR